MFKRAENGYAFGVHGHMFLSNISLCSVYMLWAISKYTWLMNDHAGHTE